MKLRMRQKFVSFEFSHPVEGFLPHQAENVHHRMTDKAGVDLLTIG